MTTYKLPSGNEVEVTKQTETAVYVTYTKGPASTKDQFGVPKMDSLTLRPDFFHKYAKLI